VPVSIRTPIPSRRISPPLGSRRSALSTIRLSPWIARCRSWIALLAQCLGRETNHFGKLQELSRQRTRLAPDHADGSRGLRILEARNRHRRRACLHRHGHFRDQGDADAGADHSSNRSSLIARSILLLGTGVPSSSPGRTSRKCSENSATSTSEGSDTGRATMAASSRPSALVESAPGVSVSRT
jgi:hypothetical protein